MARRSVLSCHGLPPFLGDRDSVAVNAFRPTKRGTEKISIAMQAPCQDEISLCAEESLTRVSWERRGPIKDGRQPKQNREKQGACWGRGHDKWLLWGTRQLNPVQ
jgi:hypothetical protein